MYAIEYYGMFVRAKDGLMTDVKPSAKLFETADEAAEYVKTWLKDTEVSLPKDRKPVNIVEVDTKVVLQKVRQVVRSF